MTSPKYAHDTDKGRYYVHPSTGERWPSVTNVLDTAVAKPALTPWAAKVTAAKAWRVLPQMVAVSRYPDRREALTKQIKAEVRYVKDTAADLGTRIHDYAEGHVLGRPTADDPEVEPYAEQLLAWFEQWGIDFDRDVEATECTVVHRTLGYAGTLDLLVHLRVDPAGKPTPRKRWLWLIDYKSSATRDVESTYPEYELQLAALRHAEFALLNDGAEEPMPNPIAAAATLNLRADCHALMGMTAGPDAHAAFAGALTVTRFLHTVDKPVRLSAPPARPARKAS